MDCALIARQLIGYHFATCEDAERDAMEHHLLECSSCLAAFLALKRDVELGESGGARPSTATRERLRRDVAAAFARAPESPRSSVPASPAARPARPWLARRIPLYQGALAAAMAAALTLLLPAAWRARPLVDTADGREATDTRSATPESHNLY